MDELKPYIEKPRDKNTSISMRDVTLAWSTSITMNNQENNKKKKKIDK